MSRTTVRIVVAVVFLLGLSAVSGTAEEARLPAAVEPLPFLDGCPAATSTGPATPLPRLDLQTFSAVPECRGCSVHNCYYQLVGTRCLINGARGTCTSNSHWCPEIRETSCTCEPL